jgi:hypothetical protein
MNLFSLTRPSVDAPKGADPLDLPGAPLREGPLDLAEGPLAEVLFAEVLFAEAPFAAGLFAAALFSVGPFFGRSLRAGPLESADVLLRIPPLLTGEALENDFSPPARRDP